MNNDFKIEHYSIISNNDEEDYYMKNKGITLEPKTKNKETKYKYKYFNKYINKEFNLVKCFILFLLFFFLFIILIAILENTQIKTIKIYNKLLKNIVESNNVDKNKKRNKNTNNLLYKNNYETIQNINDEGNVNVPDKKEEEKEKDDEEEEVIVPKKEDIYKEEKFDSLKESFNKAEKFLGKCLEGVLFNIVPNKVNEKPKISAVIPLYNSRDYILSAIRSIQNQNILNLEIVLVNDCSTDDSLSVVEKIQEKDPRIKIIRNKKNMGILYSRSIGALSAKGKYIFPLDNDDLFLDEDVFEIISNIADKGNFDLVEFKGVFSRLISSNLLSNRIQDTYYSGHKLNLVMFQPELGRYPIRPGNKMGKYDIHDVFLWTKCIRTKIYKKALNLLGEERYSRYMLLHEDIIGTIILFNTAESFKFVGKYGVFHIQREGSVSWRNENNEAKNLYNIYVIDIAIDFTKKEAENQKLLVYLIIYIFKMPQLDKTFNSNDYFRKILISCLDRVLKSKYISNEDKNIICEKGKKLKFLKYPF